MRSLSEPEEVRVPTADKVRVPTADKNRLLSRWGPVMSDGRLFDSAYPPAQYQLPTSGDPPPHGT